MLFWIVQILCKKWASSKSKLACSSYLIRLAEFRSLSASFSDLSSEYSLMVGRRPFPSCGTDSVSYEHFNLLHSLISVFFPTGSNFSKKVRAEEIVNSLIAYWWSFGNANARKLPRPMCV